MTRVSSQRRALLRMINIAGALVVTTNLSCRSSKSQPPPATMPPPLTFQELLQIKRPVELALAPDGSRIAFNVRSVDLSANTPSMTLWIVESVGGTPRQLSPSGAEVGAFQWSPSGDRLAYVANDASGGRVVVISPSGTPLQMIPAPGVRELCWAPDGARLVFNAPASDPELPQLWMADLATGRTRQLLDERAGFLEPQWSPDGLSIAYVRLPSDVPNGQFFPTIGVLDVAAGVARTVAGPEESVSSPRWSPDGTRLAYLAHPAADDAHRAFGFNRVQVLTLAGGSPLVLATNVPFAARRPAWSPDGQTIFFEAFADLTGQLFSVPSTGGDGTQLTHVPGVAFTASYGRQSSRLALLMEDPQNPPELFVSPTPTPFAPQRVTDLNESLREHNTGSSQGVHWVSTDGLDLDGVLLLPPDFQPGSPVPTLVVPHGGPASLVVLSYPDSWLLAGAPVWTSHGWAVFYPNYRGSTNRDEAFALAEVGQVGKGDYDDVTTGVDALVSSGIADPNHLAHTGWSFGGFLSGWANAHSKRYKAIVAGAGPYDWTTTYRGSVDQSPLASICKARRIRTRTNTPRAPFHPS